MSVGVLLSSTVHMLTNKFHTLNIGTQISQPLLSHQIKPYLQLHKQENILQFICIPLSKLFLMIKIRILNPLLFSKDINKALISLNSHPIQTILCRFVTVMEACSFGKMENQLQKIN